MLDGVHCLPVPGMVLWGRDFPTDLSPGFHGFCQPVTDETVQPSSEHAASARRSKGAVLFGLPIVEQIEGAILGRPFEAIEAGERCLVKTGIDGEFELRLTEPKASRLAPKAPPPPGDCEVE